MALQGIQLPSIAGVLSFKDFSNQLNNANAGVKNVANYLLNEYSKDNEREYQAEQAEKQRDFQADEARKQRSWNYEQNRLNRKNAWELQDAKFKNDKELQNLSLDRAAAEKKKVAGSNMAYMLNYQYDPSNKGSMLQAQNNIWKAMEDAKAAGYTLKELEPLGQKANLLQSEIKELETVNKLKENKAGAVSEIEKTISGGAVNQADKMIQVALANGLIDENGAARLSAMSKAKQEALAYEKFNRNKTYRDNAPRRRVY